VGSDRQLVVPSAAPKSIEAGAWPVSLLEMPESFLRAHGEPMTERIARRLAQMPKRQPKARKFEAGHSTHRIPMGHNLCGVDGCTRHKPKSARTCWRHEAKSPEVLDLERRLLGAIGGELSGKVRREESRKTAKEPHKTRLESFFEGGGATLPLPGAPEGL